MAPRSCRLVLADFCDDRQTPRMRENQKRRRAESGSPVGSISHNGQAALPAAIRCVVDVCTLNVRMIGAFSRRGDSISLTLGYPSR